MTEPTWSYDEDGNVHALDIYDAFADVVTENKRLWRALRHIYFCPLGPTACKDEDHDAAVLLIAGVK